MARKRTQSVALQQRVRRLVEEGGVEDAFNLLRKEGWEPSGSGFQAWYPTGLGLFARAYRAHLQILISRGGRLWAWQGSRLELTPTGEGFQFCWLVNTKVLQKLELLRNLEGSIEKFVAKLAQEGATEEEAKDLLWNIFYEWGFIAPAEWVPTPRGKSVISLALQVHTKALGVFGQFDTIPRGKLLDALLECSEELPLEPPISKNKVREYIKTLVDLGLIKKDRDYVVERGYNQPVWRRTDKACGVSRASTYPSHISAAVAHLSLDGSNTEFEGWHRKRVKSSPGIDPKDPGDYLQKLRKAPFSLITAKEETQRWELTARGFGGVIRLWYNPDYIGAISAALKELRKLDGDAQAFIRWYVEEGHKGLPLRPTKPGAVSLLGMFEASGLVSLVKG